MKLPRHTGILASAIVFLPTVTFGMYKPFTSLVPCGNPGDPHPICKFEDFLQLGKNLIDLGLYLVIPLATVSFAVAGFRYLAAMGSESEAAKVHGMVFGTIKGVFLTFFAWLIVSTFFNFFVNETFNPFK